MEVFLMEKNFGLNFLCSFPRIPQLKFDIWTTITHQPYLNRKTHYSSLNILSPPTSSPSSFLCAFLLSLSPKHKPNPTFKISQRKINLHFFSVVEIANTLLRCLSGQL